jgi:hypothetical protein
MSMNQHTRDRLSKIYLQQAEASAGNSTYGVGVEQGKLVGKANTRGMGSKPLRMPAGQVPMMLDNQRTKTIIGGPGHHLGPAPPYIDPSSCAIFGGHLMAGASGSVAPYGGAKPRTHRKTYQKATPRAISAPSLSEADLYAMEQQRAATMMPVVYGPAIEGGYMNLGYVSTPNLTYASSYGGAIVSKGKKKQAKRAAPRKITAKPLTKEEIDLLETKNLLTRHKTQKFDARKYAEDIPGYKELQEEADLLAKQQKQIFNAKLGSKGYEKFKERQLGYYENPEESKILRERDLLREVKRSADFQKEVADLLRAQQRGRRSARRSHDVSRNPEMYGIDPDDPNIDYELAAAIYNIAEIDREDREEAENY